MRVLLMVLLSTAFLSSFSTQALAAGQSREPLTLDEVGSAIGGFAGEASEAFTDVIKKVFEKSGQPSALILGDEMQGSFFVGYRKGDGRIMFHGQDIQSGRTLRWSAPSVGVNVGASLSKVAILVYGADGMQDLNQRFISLQGSYHVIGGAGVSYMTNKIKQEGPGKKINLVYISVGLGLDAGFAVESLIFK
jgi:hypothetical protein